MADTFVNSRVTYGSVTLFVWDGCPCCRNAWELLKGCVRPGYLQQISITGREDVQAYLQRSTGQGTVPYVFIGNQYIGGLSELQNMGAQLRPILQQMGVPLW
ncbi:glutaredoxin-1-like [Chlamydotis macqueenii]